MHLHLIFMVTDSLHMGIEDNIDALIRVGMTEEQARESGADIQVVTLPVAAIPRARVMNDTRGVLKAIVDNKTQRILGASLLCVDSHEMINIVKMVLIFMVTDSLHMGIEDNIDALIA